MGHAPNTAAGDGFLRMFGAPAPDREKQPRPQVGVVVVMTAGAGGGLGTRWDVLPGLLSLWCAEIGQVAARDMPEK